MFEGVAEFFQGLKLNKGKNHTLQEISVGLEQAAGMEIIDKRLPGDIEIWLNHRIDYHYLPPGFQTEPSGPGVSIEIALPVSHENESVILFPPSDVERIAGSHDVRYHFITCTLDDKGQPVAIRREREYPPVAFVPKEPVEGIPVYELKFGSSAGKNQVQFSSEAVSEEHGCIRWDEKSGFQVFDVSQDGSQSDFLKGTYVRPVPKAAVIRMLRISGRRF